MLLNIPGLGWNNPYMIRYNKIMKNEPKLHHYVSRAYMKRFSNDNKHVYVAFKEGEKYRIPRNPTNVDNICAEKDFYSTYRKNEEKDSSVEIMLARFEDISPNAIFALIPPDLVFPFQSGGEVLDMEHKIKIVDSIAVQISRGKTARNYGLKAVDRAFMELVNKMKNEINENYISQSELEMVIKNKDIMKQNALVKGPIIELLRGGARSLLRKNLQDRVCFFLINATGEDFITSDEPVVVCDNTDKIDGIFHCPLKNWNSVVYYPLDPKHAIALYTQQCCNSFNNTVGTSILLGSESRALVQKINLAQLSQCNRCVISKKREDLISIISR